MTNEQRKTAIEWLQEEIRSLRLAPKINGCGPENWADLLEIMETCLEAVRGHGYEPLMLEQLREMEGQPVYDLIGQQWYVIDEVFVKGNLENRNCSYAQVTMSDGEIFCRDLDYNEISGRFYAYNSELLSRERTNEDKTMRLIDAPVGLLECDGTIIMKTEYMMQSDDGSEAPECYIVESGEYFCGGVETAEELKNLEVKPVFFNATACIDRETWKPCNACVSGHLDTVGFDGRVYLCGGNSNPPKNEKFQFCPVCGRPLTPEALAELEKRLRGVIA